MLEITFETQKLRNQIPLTDEQLFGTLDHLGLRPFQYDIGENNEIILRLSYEFLCQLVDIQTVTPLASAPRVGISLGQRGRVLSS
jgi:hypothetical protein